MAGRQTDGGDTRQGPTRAEGDTREAGTPSCLPPQLPLPPQGGHHADMRFRMRCDSATPPSAAASVSRERSIVALWAAKAAKTEAPAACGRVGQQGRAGVMAGCGCRAAPEPPEPSPRPTSPHHTNHPFRPSSRLGLQQGGLGGDFDFFGDGADLEFDVDAGRFSGVEDEAGLLVFFEAGGFDG